MEENYASEGRCIYCNQIFSKRGMGKHLAEIEKTDSDKNTQSYHHIVVDASEMFLHLLVKGDTKMKNIDQFLRDIWLECCGHLSGFGHKNFDIEMHHKVDDVFEPGMKIFHDYDYGTTTRLLLKGLKQYRLNLRENIILLSRNEPLKIMCTSCKKKPAIHFCTICIWESDDAYFCESCSEMHKKNCEDFDDYGSMPIVNSPRMGVCGYSGGSIDLERDGIYKLN
jgi:hypothetical protein